MDYILHAQVLRAVPAQSQLPSRERSVQCKLKIEMGEPVFVKIRIVNDWKHREETIVAKIEK